MQQKVIILNKRSEKLVGVLHETGSQKLVILCHGFRCTKENEIMVNLAVALENEGITAFRFDFSGNGESEGSFDNGLNFESEAEDLRSVVDYFSGVNRTAVVVLGHSKGGDDVLLHASMYHDIPAVVNVSGCYDFTRGIEPRQFGNDICERLDKERYMDVKTETDGDYRVREERMREQHFDTNMRKVCLAIDENCRVLTVHGSADEVNPVEDAIEFSKVIPNHRLIIIEGANHRYTSHQAELVSSVLPFVKECYCMREGFWPNIIDFLWEKSLKCKRCLYSCC